MQVESEIADLKRRKDCERQQMQVQIEEAEGSICAPSICPSLMFLTLEEDKNCGIISWFDQGVEDFNKCFSQPKESSREVENNGESRTPSQKFQKIDRKNLSRAQSIGTSKSLQRKKQESLF